MNSSNSSNEEWTYSESKQFDNALAELDLNSPNLFENIRAIMPWKTLEQIKSRYEKLFEDVLDIERGEFDSPNYADDGDDNGDDVVDGGDPVQRKGVPWTEEEHRSFLIGLNKLGKGEWKSISRRYVPTKTTSQVACHAQKYFRRLKCSTPPQKRRYSIHDIRMLNSAIIDTSPKKPPREAARSKIPPPPNPPLMNSSFLREDNLIINQNNNFIAQQQHFNHHNNYFIAPQQHFYHNYDFAPHHFNPSSSANPQFVTTNNNITNTAPTTLATGSSSSYTEMIMGNNNNNNNNDNDNFNNINKMGYVDQYANYDDLLSAAAAPSYWFPASPSPDMTFY